MRNKAFFLALAVLLGFSSYSGFNQAHATIASIQPQTQKVLICNSSGAKVYHSHTCSGLKNCTHEVLAITKADAIKRGRRACKICYK